tara:strand:+ start:1354 stop:2202 length:849 start_codon:yes stop_codon:yes gene_type:complete
MCKTSIYYQTFIDLGSVVENPDYLDTLIISSIHFGSTNSGAPYIHLNNAPPGDTQFATVWDTTKRLSNSMEILLMIGGAGGGYNYLFTHYKQCYSLLKDTLQAYDWISGVDLDIEESVDIENIKRLMRDIKRDFGDDFKITMAPIAASLEEDVVGMGGFVYKDLFESSCGVYIDRFHVQAYGDFTLETVDLIVENGYPSDKIVLGMVTGQFDKDTFSVAIQSMHDIERHYPDMGGAFVWEYCNAPPDQDDPYKWAYLMKSKGIYAFILNTLRSIWSFFYSAA